MVFKPVSEYTHHLMSNGKVPLEEAARAILHDAARQQELSEPTDTRNLLFSYVPPVPAEAALIENKVLQRCRDIARAVASALELEASYTSPNSDLVIAAHQKLNEGAPATKRKLAVAYGAVDRLIEKFEEMWGRGKQILTQSMDPGVLDRYVFDLRYKVDLDSHSLILDLEKLLVAMCHCDAIYHELEGLWHAHKAHNMHLKFEDQEQKLRDHKDKQGVRVSQIYSCTKLLHIDFKRIENLLARDSCNIDPGQLLRQLLIHYEQTLYLQINPLAGQTGGLLVSEHEAPGLFGISYAERIQKVLDTYRNTIAVLHALRRTLRLLRL